MPPDQDPERHSPSFEPGRTIQEHSLVEGSKISRTQQIGGSPYRAQVQVDHPKRRLQARCFPVEIPILRLTRFWRRFVDLTQEARRSRHCRHTGSHQDSWSGAGGTLQSCHRLRRSSRQAREPTVAALRRFFRKKRRTWPGDALKHVQKPSACRVSTFPAPPGTATTAGRAFDRSPG